VPDATTVWLFRERLAQAKAIDRLFARFNAALKDRCYLAMGGQIIDATVVSAPKQRNTEAEKASNYRSIFRFAAGRCLIKFVNTS
jgi:IS5 family transposase